MKTTLARLSRAALCAAAIAGASHSFAQLTLTNSPAWNGSDYIFPFGEPDVATFGQVFTADATNSFMDGFTFHLRSNSGGAVDFRGYVAAWDGSRIAGPLLFESELRTLPAGTSNFQAFAFDTAGFSVTPGAQYAAFLSTSKDFDSVDGIADVGLTATQDTYTGGNLVVTANGSDFAVLSVDPWIELIGMDLAFTMEFSGPAVPEPATYGVIAGMALLALAGIRRMRHA